VTTFGWRISILMAGLSLVLAALVPQDTSLQPDVNALKKSVVRIRNTRHAEVGTGIIVKINQDGVYIVTASHVVKGDATPSLPVHAAARPFTGRGARHARGRCEGLNETGAGFIVKDYDHAGMCRNRSTRCSRRTESTRLSFW